MIDTLQKYLDNGFKLFPCKRDKSPYTAHGFKDASTDIDQIKVWLDAYPDCSWGLATGKTSGIVVIDIDPRHNGSLDSLDFPETLTVKTGGGGWHLYYKAPDVDISCSTSKLAEGIDVRGKGGYVIIPPSIHTSGLPYEFENDLPISDFPDSFIQLLTKNKSKSVNNNNGKSDWTEEVKEGARSDTVFKYGSRLKGKGLLDSEIIGLMETYNASFCKPSLDSAELNKIIKSALKQAENEPDYSEYEPIDFSDISEMPEWFNDEPFTIDMDGKSIVISGSTFNVNTGNETETIQRFKLLKATDAFVKRPRVEWLIQNVCKTNSLNVWYGKYGEKKTFLALSAAVCVATGSNWIGQKTTQCPVLIIDEESGEYTLMDRLKAAIKGESQSEDIPVYSLSLSGFNFLRNDEDIAHLKKYIDLVQARFIIIDAFADIMSGGDENTVKDNIPVLLKLRKVCNDTNSAIVLLHHTNKNGEIRGSTSIGGAINSALKIVSPNESSKITISTEKMRDEKTFSKKAEIVFVNSVNEWDDDELDKFYITEGEPSEFWQDETTEWEDTVMSEVTSKGGLVQSEFLSKVDPKNVASYKKAIYSLRDKGKIVKAPVSTPRQSVWELPNEISS